MAFAHIQHAQQQFGNSASARTLAYGSNVAVGDLLICSIGAYNGTAMTFTVTDNLNGAWTQACLSRAGSVTQALWYFAPTVAGACTVTVTPSESALMSLGIIEFSGQALSPLDFTATANGSSAAAFTGAVSCATGDLVIAAFSQSSANVAYTIPDGGYSLWENVTQGRTGGNPSAGAASGLKYGTAPQDYGCNFYMDASVTYAAAIASFKAFSSVTPPTTTRGLSLLGKVPDKDQRRRRHNDLVTDILDSLLRNGQLIQTSPAEWRIKV